MGPEAVELTSGVPDDTDAKARCTTPAKPMRAYSPEAPEALQMSSFASWKRRQPFHIHLVAELPTAIGPPERRREEPDVGANCMKTP